LDAVGYSHVVAIDEVGPMELFSERLREAARKALESRKLVVAIVHWKAQDILIRQAKEREDTETITVTIENRQNLHEQIAEKALKFLMQT
jgi:nucleoside-triphosphatase